MGWRLARSLEVLRDEIWSVHPKTTVWTLGDEDHADEPSDHNPNARGVVCAADVLGDGGLNLGEFAERVRTSNHQAFKYVIYDRRIAMRGGDWEPYSGTNPHTTHVHVSVGRGPDGQSTGPYDNRTQWNVLEDDVSWDEKLELPEWARKQWPEDWKKGGSAGGLLTRAYSYGRSNHETLTAILARVEEMSEASAATALIADLRDLMARGATPEQVVDFLTDRLDL
jgi:hypothetical protein